MNHPNCSPKGTSLSFLREQRDRLKWAARVFAGLYRLNGNDYVSIGGSQVMVSDLRSVAATFNALDREVRRRNGKTMEDTE